MCTVRSTAPLRNEIVFFCSICFALPSFIYFRCRESAMFDSAAEEEEEDDCMPTPVKAKAKPAARGKATAGASKAAKPKPPAAAKRSKAGTSKAVRKYTITKDRNK